MPAIQATVVACGGRGILIAGEPGTGKSTLALQLIDRGAMLVGDDGIMLDTRAGKVWASPHPRTRGLIEVRNLGVVELPVCDEVRVCLCLNLAIGAPRFVEHASERLLEGVAVPLLDLTAHGPALAIKAELALAKFGLADA